MLNPKMVGETVRPLSQAGDDWIITDILSDGKFKAVPKKQIIEIYRDVNDTLEMPSTKKIMEFIADEPNHGLSETFDISGKIDTKHFVYKLNEEAIPKEARKMGLIVDGKIKKDNGEWWKIEIPKERSKMPVEAFGTIGFPIGAGVKGLLDKMNEKENKKVGEENLLIKLLKQNKKEK
jgi:hypothetical protein